MLWSVGFDACGCHDLPLGLVFDIVPVSTSTTLLFTHYTFLSWWFQGLIYIWVIGHEVGVCQHMAK